MFSHFLAPSKSCFRNLKKANRINSFLKYRNIKIRDGTEEKEKDVNFPISNGGFNSIDKKLINNQKDFG